MTGIPLNRFPRIALDGERLTKELEAARQVQELLLPAATTQVPGFVVDGAYTGDQSAIETAETAKTWGQNDDLTVVAVRRTV